MQLNRIIIVWLALCGIVCAEGLRNIVGVYTNGQSLATGRVAVSTNDNTFWVGNATSNAVKVGDVAWSNNVSASVTNGLASTNYVHAQGFVTGAITNGLADTNYVNASVAGRVATNDAAYLAAASTNYVHAQGFVTASVTNGLADTNFVNSAVDGRVATNDAAYLAAASTNYVHAQGFVTATITNGLADTNFVNSAVANRPVTNAWNTLSLIITNSHPGTNAWLRSDDGTNLYWQAAP